VADTLLRFRLSIPARRFLAYYQGHARTVMVRSTDGRRVRFPANILRPYVTKEGIFGEFVLEVDAEHKFVGLRRLGD